MVTGVVKVTLDPPYTAPVAASTLAAVVLLLDQEPLAPVVVSVTVEFEHTVEFPLIIPETGTGSTDMLYTVVDEPQLIDVTWKVMVTGVDTVTPAFADTTPEPFTDAAAGALLLHVPLPIVPLVVKEI